TCPSVLEFNHSLPNQDGAHLATVVVPAAADLGRSSTWSRQETRAGTPPWRRARGATAACRRSPGARHVARRAWHWVSAGYVLFNRRKHRATERGLDPCSSAPWFNGWREPIIAPSGPPPIVPPRTWLAAVGWRRHGLLGTDDRPRG